MNTPTLFERFKEKTPFYRMGKRNIGTPAGWIKFNKYAGKKRWSGEGERERRKRQIERGILKVN